MRSYRTLLAVPAVVALAVAVGGSRADDPKAPPADEPAMTEAQSKALRAVDDLDTAGRMIELGRRTKTPEVLIAAALILHATPADETLDKPEAASAAAEPAALLAEAAKLRPQDKSLQEAVAAARERVKEATRGGTSGAKTYGTFKVGVGKVSDTVQTFVGICRATLRVTNTAPTWKPRGFSLVEPSFAKLEVVNAAGKVVAQNAYFPVSKPDSVSWNAGAKAAKFTLRVVNTSPPGVGQPKGVDVICTLGHN